MFEYQMKGMETPPAIDAMNRYLLTLQCINRIDFFETESELNPDSPKLPIAFQQALDNATTLLKAIIFQLNAMRGNIH